MTSKQKKSQLGEQLQPKTYPAGTLEKSRKGRTNTTERDRRQNRGYPAFPHYGFHPLYGPYPDRLTFRTQLVEAGEAIFIADNVSVLWVVQNHGPGKVGIPFNEQSLVKILPGALRVQKMNGELSLHNLDNEPALVEMEFLPVFEK
jgi:hypothetical protein